MKRFAILFSALCGPAWAECPGGAEPVFACTLLNSDDVELCMIDDKVRMRMGFDVDDPAEEILMPLSVMPYLSTGIAQSGEDFSYAKFFKGDQVYTVGLDRDLEMASVSVGSQIDYLPDSDFICSEEGLIDQFPMLDAAMKQIGRSAPVVAAQPIGGECGPIQTLGPADWHDDQDVSPIHIQPQDTVVEVLFAGDQARVCGASVDDWYPVRYLSDAFSCDLNNPDAPGAVCSSGWVHVSQLAPIEAEQRPQALACQAGGFRFAMVRAESGDVTMMNEGLTLTLSPGNGPRTTTDLGDEQLLRVDDKLVLQIDYSDLSITATHSDLGEQLGQCVEIDIDEVLGN